MRRTIGKKLPVDRVHGDFVSKCDICGVPYYRSQLRRNESGLLYCPSGCHKMDHARLHRRNAEMALDYADKQAELAEAVFDGAPYRFVVTEDPLDILGSACAFWLSADGASDDTWVDETGNLTLTGSCTATRSPTGMLVVDFDGVSQSMSGTLVTPIAVGSRPYLWVLGQHTGDPDPTDHLPTWALLCLQSADSGTSLQLGSRYADGEAPLERRRFTFLSLDSLGATRWFSEVFDRKPRLLEANCAASSVDRLFVDEVAFDTIDVVSSDPTAALDRPLTSVAVADLVSGGGQAKCRIRDIVVSRTQPDEDMLERMRAYFRTREGFEL